MNTASTSPEVARRLSDELANFLAQHGLKATWHPKSNILRLEGAAAPVAVVLDDPFIADFDRANADIQSCALLSICSMVEMRYDPKAHAQLALNIKPDPRCLSED